MRYILSKFLHLALRDKCLSCTDSLLNTFSLSDSFSGMFSSKYSGRCLESLGFSNDLKQSFPEDEFMYGID